VGRLSQCPVNKGEATSVGVHAPWSELKPDFFFSVLLSSRRAGLSNFV